ncbi:hypothetical protein MIMGU_mgv1a016351mg [Erythranthe guttata]|uniref:Uncharacterized protein n=1 Tax=Erythranthe guttata TaxID=4155 RepID=A0A022R8K2_ERYGU|nr:hypothetical protein MIMGU_mgv1a016351mg [Erythranthe guttata]
MFICSIGLTRNPLVIFGFGKKLYHKQNNQSGNIIVIIIQKKLIDFNFKKCVHIIIFGRFRFKRTKSIDIYSNLYRSNFFFIHISTLFSYIEESLNQKQQNIFIQSRYIYILPRYTYFSFSVEHI